MKKLTKLFYLLLILGILQGCSDDDMMREVMEGEEIFIDQNPFGLEEGEFIDIGEYHLAHSSIARLPYLDKKQIVFVDSLGSEVVFDIDEGGLQEGLFALRYRYDVVEEGDTVKYLYRFETKGFTIENDVLDMTFRLSLSAEPYFADLESEKVADVLTMFCDDPDPEIFSSGVFNHVTDVRSWDMAYNNDPVDQMEIMGRTFSDVLSNDYPDPKSKVFFNYEFGILSFTDLEGKRWRFEELR